MVSRNGPEVYMCVIKFQLKLLSNRFKVGNTKSCKIQLRTVTYEILPSLRNFTLVSDFLGISNALDFSDAKIGGAVLLYSKRNFWRIRYRNCVTMKICSVEHFRIILSEKFNFSLSFVSYQELTCSTVKRAGSIAFANWESTFPVFCTV